MRWSLIAFLAIAACNPWGGGTHRGIPAPPSPQSSASIPHSGGTVFKLVAYGGPDWTTLVADLRPCCHELRAGWLLNRESRWVAVDTVSVVRRETLGNATTILIDPTVPPVIRADSGGLYRSGDTLYYMSDLAPQVISKTGSPAIVVGDTITIRVRTPGGGFSFLENSRKYVRVRR